MIICIAVSIIEREDSLSYFKDKAVSCSAVSSDKQAVKMSRQSQHFITWTHLKKFQHHYEEGMEEDRLKVGKMKWSFVFKNVLENGR